MYTPGYIYRQGGLRSPPLHWQARDLLVWAPVRLALLRAAYIPGSLTRQQACC